MALDNEILGHGVYTPREAARLVGETPQQVLRWTRGSGPSDPLWNAYYQFIDDSSELSFLDLVEIRVVSAMRRGGISLQSIRFAIQYAQEKLGVEHPLSSREFKVDGTELLMEAIENDGQYVSLSKKRPGQKVFKEIVRQSLSDLEYEGDYVARWRPTGHESVVIDPTRSFGDPILDQFGISTAMLFRETQAFEGTRYISEVYEIPIQIVKQAIAFERSLDRRAKQSDGPGTI